MNSLGGFQSPCGSSIHRCDFLPKSKIALHPRLDFRGSLFGDKSISLLRSAKRTTTMADTSSESATIGLNAVLSPCAITNSWHLITAFFLIIWMVFLRRKESPAKVERFLPRIVEEMVKKEVEVRRAIAIKRVLEGNEDENSKREYSLFCSKRGDAIFTQSWTPVNVHVRGLVVVMHGLNEHSGRYNDFAKKLNANGFKVYGMDWIGHGGSDGLHAYVHSVDYAVNDLKLFISKVLAENPGLPCFCFGHSTGGAIILKTMLDPEVRQRVKGIVLTSPAVGVQPSHPIFTVIAPLFSLLAPRFQLRAATRIGVAVCRDPQALVAKYSDLLVFTGSIRVRTGYEILRTAAFLQRNIGSLTVPFLVLHGTSDSVTSPAASLKLYEASSTDKTIKLCEGLLHDLLFEPQFRFQPMKIEAATTGSSIHQNMNG